jgi:hypothetical protein
MDTQTRTGAVSKHTFRTQFFSALGRLSLKSLFFCWTNLKITCFTQETQDLNILVILNTLKRRVSLTRRRVRTNLLPLLAMPGSAPCILKKLVGNEARRSNSFKECACISEKLSVEAMANEQQRAYSVVCVCVRLYKTVT